jgi:hypothetical protein
MFACAAKLSTHFGRTIAPCPNSAVGAVVQAQISAMQVPGTPCLVVDGKYRVELDTLSSAADVIDLVNLLVKKASRR